MKNISVEYYPLKWLGWKRVAKGSHPERWEEVTGAQLVAIACTYKGNISDSRFLSKMTGVKTRIIKRLDDFHRYKLMELLEFINDRKPYGCFIIEKLLAGGIQFFAPKPHLKGMTLGQFIFADTLFGEYQESNNAEDMSKFLAAMYLPYGEKFKDDMIEQNQFFMDGIDVVTREAVIINYQLVKEWLTEKYPLVFVREEEIGSRKSEVGGKKRDPLAWIKIFESLVGDDIVNEDKYASMPVNNVLRYLSMRIKDNMKRKK